MLESAPVGFDSRPPLDPSLLGMVLAEHADADGRELTLRDDSGEAHLRLPPEPAARRPAVLVPLDEAFQLRFEAALHIARRLSGQPGALVPRALRLTSSQKRRLVQLLHAFDVRDAGGGPRDVAAKVLASDQATLPSTEWKDSHARRKANRLIRDAVSLVERDYLTLLRGG